jgi:phosphoglycerate kinase
MKTVANYNFAHKKALIRVDFNVPLDKQTLAVTDTTRIEGASATIAKILADGGSVILMSHLGRPKGAPEDKYSLRHIVDAVSEILGVKVQFVSDCVGDAVSQAVAALQMGEVLLLENLRFHLEEEKGNPDFAQALANLGADVYVNDAFGTAHRAHASTAIIAQYFAPENRMFGYLMEKEIVNAQRILNNPERPFTAILGGAKVSDKILLIESLLDKVDNLLIGGGMAYTFFKAQGGNIGKSLVEDDKLTLAQTLLQMAKDKGVNLLLPTDSVAADAFANDAQTQICDNKQIPDGYMGLDIGENGRKTFSDTILNSKTIFWNGPMGVFEMSNFQAGTYAVAAAVAQATAQNGAYSLIGGGDSVAAIQQFGFADDVSYVSTGGGAMLELLEGKELPGIAAIAQ